MNTSTAFFTAQLHSELGPEIETARALCIAVALISKRGVAVLREKTPAGAPIELLVGLDLPTKPAALTRLLAWSNEVQGVAVRVWTREKGAGYFHPKVYLVEQSTEWVAFVGSANCTDGGWQDNEELTARVTGEAADELRRNWFATRFAAGLPLSTEFIEAYATAFAARVAAEKAARIAAKKANRDFQEWLEQQKAATAQVPVGMARPVRPGQFFREEHYAAFDDPKPLSQTATADRERYAVYDQMKILHHELAPRVSAAGWDLHPHYEPDNVVSSPEHTQRTEKAIRAMWLNYGRHKDDIKYYGKEFTPMVFIRLEAIIFNDHFATWCRIGKDGAFDREAFKVKMREAANRIAYFDLLQSLGDQYFIEVKGVRRFLTTFTDADALADFVRSDRQDYYFVIGKDYQPNDSEISESRVAETVMGDWAQLYRVYQWMKRPE